jgi:hypothetical protein
MGWDHTSELQQPTSLLFIPQMLFEYGEPHAMILTEKTKELREKPVPVPFFLPKIPHVLTWMWTQAYMVTNCLNYGMAVMGTCSCVYFASSNYSLIHYTETLPNNAVVCLYCISLYGGNAPFIFWEKVVLHSSWYVTHHKHICAFLKVNKLFKRPHFYHGQGSWIASFSRDPV